ncbi:MULTISPECIES: RHS repeat domain-containing protein [unclassified Paenibacillus]|uniref:RHS repeat domain-containing protein n=1 Tax=unclassified Paenibacillus TaxID=185978 RepID=UPI00048FD5D6|nr:MULTISPECIES: RHS repeat domain-containing protein [unclassified Paenibacillus]SDE38757.1 YD repeat-containing protein [Paenibacillus sp. cl6col]
MSSFRPSKFMLVLVLISLTLLTISQTKGFAAEKTAVNVYDSSGRLVNTKLADGTVVEYQYDVNGNLLHKNINMLMNSGFEIYTGKNGVADNWGDWKSAGVKANYQVVTAPVSSGKHAQQMKISNMPKDGGANFFQDISVSDGQLYSLSSQITIANLNKAKLIVNMHYFDNNNSFIGSETVFEYGGNASWLSINEQVRPVAKTVRARLHFTIIALDNDGSGTLTVDSVTFQKGERSNLLINPGFETNTRTSGVADGWGNWESAGVPANYRVVTSQVSSGKQAQQMVISNIPKDGMHTIFQDVAVTGGQPYTLSGQIATENLSKAKVQVIMHYFDINNNFIGNETPFEYSGNTGWLSINEQVRPVAKAVRARVHFNVLAVDNNASGIVKVDSVTFQKGERSNLLINPGFETNTRTSGVADGWDNWESAGVKANYRVVTSPVSSGKHAQQMSISNIPKDGMHTFFQDVAVTGGQPYTLGSQIAITNLSKAKFQVIMHYFDVNNNFIGNETPFEYSDNTSWKSVQVQVKPPAHTVRARVHFNLLASEDKASGKVTVDSVIFQRIK